MTSPPAWLAALVEQVINSVEAHQPAAFGYRYAPAEAGEPWEIILYPTPVPLHGGAEEGVVVSPGFSLDLKPLYEAFETVEALYWTAQSFGPHDPDNPSVALEGRYQGQSVYLRIQAYAPEDEPPGLDLDVSPQAGGGAVH